MTRLHCLSLVSVCAFSGAVPFGDLQPNGANSPSVRGSSDHSAAMFHQKDEKQPLGPVAKDSPVEVFASLDKSRVCPGEEVRLSETIPQSQKASVFKLAHQVALIAPYDIKTQRLRNLGLNSYRLCDVEKEFADLPVNTIVFGNKTWPFSINNKSEKGYEFKIKPSHLGVYQITARWGIREGEGIISSQPVILIVEPPVDENGQRKIKKEWLRDN